MAIVKKPTYTYTGEVNSLGQPHGKGKVEFINGEVSTGSFKNGKREGYCSTYYGKESRRFNYEGDYIADKPDGYGLIIYKNGDSFQGTFKEGKRHGYGTYFYKKKDSYGQETYYGAYHMGLKYGKFVFHDKYGHDKISYESEWSGDAPERKPEPPRAVSAAAVNRTKTAAAGNQNEAKSKNPSDRMALGIDKGDFYDGPTSPSGLPHGRGRYRYSSGDVYSGDFYYGKLEGKGWYEYKDGSHYEGEFKNGLPHGKGKQVPKDWRGFGFKWAQTSLLDGEFVNGVFTKGDIFYKKSGEDDVTERYSGAVKNGLPHGHGVYTEKDGSTYTGEFYMGKRHGYGTYVKMSDGSTYSGQWEYGVRHGLGELKYRNESDYYGWKNKLGFWKNDVFIG